MRMKIAAALVHNVMHEARHNDFIVWFFSTFHFSKKNYRLSVPFHRIMSISLPYFGFLLIFLYH